MSFELNLSTDETYDGFTGSFKICNMRGGNITYYGTMYEYNQIQFITKSGGMAQWLSDYMGFEEHEATYIAEQLNNWQNFINNSNNKE